MSIANLGSSIGSKVYGMVSEQASFTDAYLLLGALAGPCWCRCRFTGIDMALITPG